MQDRGERPEEPSLQAPTAEPGASGPMLALVSATGLAIIALILAAVKGAPYLDFSSLNGWVALFAAASFGALLSVPFAAERRLRAAQPQQAERWEPAMLIWGGVALAALLLGVLLMWVGRFAPTDSLADAAALLLVIEAGLIVVCLLAWLLSG